MKTCAPSRRLHHLLPEALVALELQASNNPGLSTSAATVLMMPKTQTILWAQLALLQGLVALKIQTILRAPLVLLRDLMELKTVAIVRTQLLAARILHLQASRSLIHWL
jgi:hypothetical protein